MIELLPFLIKEAVGLFTSNKEVAQVAVENKELVLSGSTVVFGGVVYILRKFFKTPDKMLKFRRGWDQATVFVVALGAEMMRFSKYMKKKCVGGVCEIKEDDNKRD